MNLPRVRLPTVPCIDEVKERVRGQSKPDVRVRIRPFDRMLNVHAEVVEDGIGGSGGRLFPQERL